MKKNLLVCTLCALILACGTPKENSSTISEKKHPEDPTIYANTITSEELKEMLYTYASDEFEGRETGEPGQKLAVNYLKEQYMALGTPSPFSNDNYFQEVPLERQRIADAQVKVNGKSAIAFDDFIPSSYVNVPAFSVNQIVYVGYGIDSENYSDYKDIDVKGKIVVFKSGEPMNADSTYVTSGTKEKTKWTSGRNARKLKIDTAKKLGAKGIFVLDNRAHTYYSKVYKRLDESGYKGTISSARDDENEAFYFLINQSFASTLVKDISTNHKPRVIDTNLEIAIKKNYENISSENVVAYIEGAEKPNEVLVISAHLDHEGVKDGNVYNGADDDGSGTVALLEIAEAFKTAMKDGIKPKRSILFLHVTGEEKGLLGSKYYTDKDPIFPLENTVANLNIDMIGRVSPKRKGDRNYVYVIGSDKLSSDLHQLSEAVNAKYTNIDLDYTYNDDNDPNRYYYRSDHYNFAKNNIPVIFYFNGTHDDYHKPTDTADKIQYDLLENRTRLVFYTAWEVANRDKRVIVDKVETTTAP
ncbi:M28 family peptidase [uncultured Psychroserpens sp.]|uniref:M28 family peptidase n=1 Tax=uncultured Psychroserpens sp. TaxID=255436 RepID=UPI00260161E5|nr:M28 family peptidase [uncultured Psychroserpens sp.]